VWQIHHLSGTQTLTALHAGYRFEPGAVSVNQAQQVVFKGRYAAQDKEQRIERWLLSQQRGNGLIPSTDNGVVSLYDQALAAMAFLITGNTHRAEAIFNFFNARIASELEAVPGGFSQFRDLNGVPNNHRWMGDNAWLLIALNNYEHLTGKTTYAPLQEALGTWLLSLQDTDGGFWAGYDASGNRLNYKVTEGNIDAYNALPGYTQVHVQLLRFLEDQRWDAATHSLMAWPENPPYRYALDCHSWSYCLFRDFPAATLETAERFKTTQTATLSGNTVTGYDIDDDLDHVFLEGCAQMALAYTLAGRADAGARILRDMEQAWYTTPSEPETGGFPYASNFGTGYGDSPHWNGVDTKIALSPGVWYLFAKRGFNPFRVGLKHGVPDEDRFWKN
jgi:hypothetical protein